MASSFLAVGQDLDINTIKTFSITSVTGILLAPHLMIHIGKRFSRISLESRNAVRNVQQTNGIWIMQQVGRSYGKVKVKRNNPRLDEVPDDCGYMQRFEYNVDMNSNGIMGECIDWCQRNCEGKWGWWFEPAGEIENPKNHWEHQNAYMSFERKLDATRFWMSVGIQNSGRK